MRGRLMRAPIVFVAIVGVAATLLSPAGARPEASRIVDRTFLCESGFVGGLYRLDVNSQYSTGQGSSELTVYSSVTRDMYESPLGALSSSGLAIHRERCVPTKGALKLSTTGMRGGAVPPLGTASTCETPRRVLLRVRAVFERPVTPRTSKRFGFPQLIAEGSVKEAALAIGTRAGKAIAYLSVTGAEHARLFTVRTCEED